MDLHLVYEKARVPSTRIRLIQLVPALERHGFRCLVTPYPGSADAWRRFAAGVGAGDAVLVHRARPTRREARRWRALPATLVYDFDDAIMFGRRQGPLGALARRRRAAGFRRMLRCCSAIACGNAFLADQCGDFAGPVRVVPSAVRSDVPRADPPPGPLRIGWVGRRSNLRSLAAIGPTLARVASRRDVVLSIVSDGTLAIPGVRVEHVPWTLEGEAHAVARLHVGVMPLEDDRWSRGKCAYKLLQYMAAGVPAVGSRVGTNADLIDAGRNGLLADGPGDWEAALVALADDAALRARLGRAGRETVLAGYTVDGVAARLASLLEEACGVPSSSAAVASTTGSTANAAARRTSASR